MSIEMVVVAIWVAACLVVLIAGPAAFAREYHRNPKPRHRGRHRAPVDWAGIAVNGMAVATNIIGGLIGHAAAAWRSHTRSPAWKALPWT